MFFMHIPKTGGSSIEKYFLQLRCRVDFFQEFNHLQDLMRCSPVNHLDYEVIDKIFDLKKFVFRFAVVRNPFARLASEFRFRKGRNRNWSKDAIVYDQVEPWCLDVLTSYAKNKYYFSNHLRPQSDFIGPKIQKVYKLESGLSPIIENIGQTLSKFNLSLPSYDSIKGLEDKMVTTKDTRRGILTKEEKLIRESSVVSELVKHVYRRDFDAFDYR